MDTIDFILKFLVVRIGKTAHISKRKDTTQVPLS